MKVTNEQLKLAADTVRCLCADIVEKANSGHPGAAMGMADLAVTLCANGTRSLILGHISRHNNTPATALQTVSAALREALPDALQPELVAAPECGPLSVEVKVSAPCSL